MLGEFYNFTEAVKIDGQKILLDLLDSLGLSTWESCLLVQTFKTFKNENRIHDLYECLIDFKRIVLTGFNKAV